MLDWRIDRGPLVRGGAPVLVCGGVEVEGLSMAQMEQILGAYDESVDLSEDDYVEGLEDEIDELKQRIDVLVIQQDGVEEERDNLQERIEELEEERDNLQERIEELEEKLKAAGVE